MVASKKEKQNKKQGKLLTKKLMLQGYECRLKSSFCNFYSRYNDLICDYRLSLAHMLNDLFHTRFQSGSDEG
jgi:hypothetical protein